MKPKISLIVLLTIIGVSAVGYYFNINYHASSPKLTVKSSPVISVIPSPSISFQESIQNAVRNDLAKRLSVNPSRVSIVKIEKQGWSDGSLDCPEPGKFYTLATTSGIEIILEYSRKNYKYHAVNENHFVYCDK